MTIYYPQLLPAIFIPFSQRTDETQFIDKEIKFNFDQLAKTFIYYQELQNLLK